MDPAVNLRARHKVHEGRLVAGDLVRTDALEYAQLVDLGVSALGSAVKGLLLADVAVFGEVGFLAEEVDPHFVLKQLVLAD